MSEQDETGKEEFLARWSRRKLEGETEAEQKSDAAQAPAPAAVPAKEPAVAAFDVSSLPSIESITAKSDITAFLRPGVPSELKHAALRRAWVTDPAIRDFVGLHDYDFVFGTPEMFGMGELPAGTDVARLLSDVFGHKPANEGSQASAPPANPQQQPVRLAEKSEPPEAASTETQIESSAQDSEQPPDGADQNAAQQHEPAPRKLKRHGGALPHS